MRVLCSEVSLRTIKPANKIVFLCLRVWVMSQNILTFTDLLHAAKAQAEPQLLLMVFVKAEMPESPTSEQIAAVENGQGGNLTPVLCVDKYPQDLTSMNDLVAESQATGHAWDLVFVSAMSGVAGFAPTTEQAEQPLQMMVQAIHSGNIAQFLAFDQQGEVLSFY